MQPTGALPPRRSLGPYLLTALIGLSSSIVLGQDCGSYTETGSSDFYQKIAGGFRAKPGQFPSYVRLVIHYGFPKFTVGLCGATVLDDQHVITAAHCLEKSPSSIEVLDFNYRKINSARTYCVSPKYRNNIPDKQHKMAAVVYDLAVIKLKKRLIFSDMLQPACLPDKELDFNQQAYAAGMGRTEVEKNPRELFGLPVKRDECGIFQNSHVSVICFKNNKRQRGQTCVGEYQMTSSVNSTFNSCKYHLLDH